ncbi:MAG TPA: hypothetical protein VF502_11115 [Stellaceae bacterium]
MKTRNLLLAGAAAILVASAVAVAQTMPEHAGQPDMKAMMQQHGGGMMQDHGAMMQQHGAMMQGMGDAGTPMLPGQDAFGAVQEIVRMLEADANTDWTKVDLPALREHLIDMNEVTLKAKADERPIEHGLEVAVTGSGRTLEAIQRMLPAHAQELNGLHGWTAESSALPDGVLLKVTSADPGEVAHIRGLGFIGLLASGSHHQPHHLAMAKGERHIH